MLDFKPPKPNSLFIKIAQGLMPFVLRGPLKISKFVIDSESLEHLKAIANYPTVLVPNHADYADASIMFALSKRMEDQFYYMCARETFRGGIRSFLMQRFGVYSVVRGSIDREAFRTTRRLLAEGQHPLVMFAEGEISRQNDTVLPFESGVIQLCFWALDDMTKAGAVKPLYAVPIGIKYIYAEEMWDEIEKALARLEREILPQRSPTSEDLYERLRGVGAAVVSTLEREYRLQADENRSLNERIEQLRERILSQMEEFMGVTPQTTVLPRTRVRALKNLVDAEIYRETEEISAYERQIHEQRLETFQEFYPDLNRLINFIAIYDGYVGENRSPERFLEVITRLEREVFGSSKPRGPRIAFMRFGTPKNLLDLYDSYKRQKKQTVQDITLELETEVQELISGISHQPS